MTVIEGEIVESAAPLAVLEPQSGIMPVVSPDEARAQMRAYQELCAAVLTEDDYQEFAETKNQKVDGRWQKVTTTKRFKKKSAVKKLQTYFGISVDVIDDATHRDDLGEGHFGFRCKAVAESPGGRRVAALGGCSTHEERFDVNRYDDESDVRYAARQKKALARSYHDVLSTAETRATNRAVMNLVSPGEVTAEEISRPSRGDRGKPAEPDPNDLADQAARGGRHSRPVARVPQDELLALAHSHGIDGLKAFGEWCVEAEIATDLLARERKVLTNEETQAAKARLESIPQPAVLLKPAPAAGAGAGSAAAKADDGGKPSARTQGRLFALLDERLSTDKAARITFAAEHGIVVDSFSKLTELQARQLIRALEMIKPPEAEPDPDDSLADYTEGRLL